MKPELKQLASHRLERAKEALSDGEMLAAKGSCSGAANRLYYAAFYAARALLATKELDSSRHSGIISLFNQHFVKSGIFNIDVARALSRAFELRQDLDYEDFISPSRASVQETQNEVSEFVMECERILNSL